METNRSLEFIPLAFGLEAFYPPMKLTPQALRDMYVRLAEPCRFSEFKLFGGDQGARLAEGSNRYLHLTHDRIVYRDDFTQVLFSVFVEDMEQILSTLQMVFRVPVLLHSKVLVRLLLPYSSNETTVDFFQKTLLGTASTSTMHFTRPISGSGLRMVFPPSQENHSTFHLRIEPYFPDLKMFFLENSAQFFDPLIQFRDIRKYLTEAYEFLKEQAGPFVLSMAPDA